MRTWYRSQIDHTARHVFNGIYLETFIQFYDMSIMFIHL